jgi:DNA-binding NtrC family response regulator
MGTVLHDKSIRTALTTILEEKDYAVETAETGKEGIKKSHEAFYNLASIDIQLLDMEAIELLTKMVPTTPKMRKTIVTGYTTLQNAIEAVNNGADAQVMKTFDMENALESVRERLEKQEEETKCSREKAIVFIETRLKVLEEEKHVILKKP